MRHRRWVVAVAAVVVGVLPLLFVALRVGSRHPAFQRAVLARILPRAAGMASVGELDVGLASLRLSHVVVEPSPTVRVIVPSATVQLHYGRLLASRFDIRSALGTILVTSPRVRVTCAPAPPSEETAPGGPLDLAYVESILPTYLGVSDGSVVFVSEATGESLVVRSVDCVLERKSETLVRGSATGDAMGGRGNLRADLAWDLESDSLSVDGELADAEFDAGAAAPFPRGLAAFTGRVSARFLILAGDTAPPSASVDLTVDGGQLALPGDLGTLSDVSGDAVLSAGTLSVEHARAQWEGASLLAAGGLDLRGGSFRRLTVSVASLEARRLSALGVGPPDLQGALDVSATLEGPFSEPRAAFAAVASDLRAGRVRLSDVDLRAAWRGDSLSVQSFRARSLGGRIVAAGSIERLAPSAPWRFEIEGHAVGVDASELAALGGGVSARGTVSVRDVRAAGTSDSPNIEGLIVWDGLEVGAVRLGDGGGGFLLADGDLSTTATTAHGSASLSGQIVNVPGQRVVDAEISFSAARIDSLLALPAGVALPVTIDGSVRVVGPPGGVALRGSLLVAGRDGGATVSIDGTLADAGGDAKLVLALDAPDAVVRGVALPLRAEATVDRSELAVPRVDLGSYGHATARVGFGDPRSIQAGLAVSEARLPDLLSLVTGRPVPRGVNGLVFASASVGGTLDDPSGAAQVEVADAEVLGVAGLFLSTRAVLGDGVVTIEDLTVRRGDRRVATASGTVDLRGDLAVSVAGDAVPGPLLGGSAETAFDVTFGLGGEVSRPTLDGRVESSGGELLGVAYDDLAARLSGAEGSLSLDRLALTRRGSYTVTASGRVPWGVLRGGDAPGEGSLTVDVSGNPLDFLAQLLPPVSSADGSGSMRLHLVGRPGDFTVANGWLDATASRVRTIAPFDEMRDVSAHVVVSDGAVVEGVVAGTVDGNPIRVESRRDVEVRGRPAEPLVAAEVDLGALVLSTPGGGVRASVPGLMLPESVGRIAIRGSGTPEFVIAGPAERPNLLGEIEFSDTEFTYPFASSAEGDPIGGLFRGAEWSIRMVAGRNVWYWRPDASLEIARGGALDFAGVPSEGNLCVSGRLESTRGTLSYMENDFDVALVFVEFPPFCEPPRFYAEAATRVEDGTTITLTMDSFESAFAIEAPGAPLAETALRLSSDSPDDTSQDDALSRLQYGADYELLGGEEQAALERRRAIEVIGAQIGGRVVRPLLSPIEGRLRRRLGLDLVRFDVDFVERFLSELDQWYAQEGGTGYRPFLADSRITVGKYVTRDWLVSYVGRAETYEEDIGDQRLGLRHEIGLEYEVSRNTSLSLRAVYDPSLAGWDRRVTIENRFRF